MWCATVIGGLDCKHTGQCAKIGTMPGECPSETPMWIARIEFRPDMTPQEQNLCWWVVCRDWLWNMQQAMVEEPGRQICARPSPAWMRGLLGVER